MEKRRRKPRVSWPPRCALLPGEGPRRTPPSLWGRREGPANPAATRLPARGGGAAGHLPLPVQSDRTHHTSTTRPRARGVIKHFRVRRQLFTGNLCTPGKVPGGRAQTGRRPAASTPRCERFGNAAPPRRAGRSHQLKRRSDQGRSGSPDPGRIRRGLHARLRGGASTLGC